jgi:hypothetical protein
MRRLRMATNVECFEADYGSNWFLPSVGLALLCLYLLILNVEAGSQLKAVCDVAIGEDALTLCLQYGAR